MSTSNILQQDCCLGGSRPRKDERPVLQEVRKGVDASIQARAGYPLQVQIWQGHWASTDVSDEEHYDNALALLAAGLGSHNPKHIETALQILDKLGNKLEPATGRLSPRAIPQHCRHQIC